MKIHVWLALLCLRSYEGYGCKEDHLLQLPDAGSSWVRGTLCYKKNCCYKTTLAVGCSQPPKWQSDSEDCLNGVSLRVSVGQWLQCRSHSRTWETRFKSHSATASY